MTCATATPLWTSAKSWLDELILEFGAPEQIAQLVSQRVRTALKRHLKALEGLVLKLLLIEAAKLRPPGPPASPPALSASHPVRRGVRGKRVAGEDAGGPRKCGTRSASFSLRIPANVAPPPAKPDTSGPRVRDLGPPLRMTDIWRANAERERAARLQRMHDPLIAWRNAPANARRLARRIEAIRLVLAEPARHVRRLIRKLASLGRAALDAACRIAFGRAPRVAKHVDIQGTVLIEASRATNAFRDSS